MVKVKSVNYKLLLFLAVAITISSGAFLPAQTNQSNIADKARSLTGTQWKLIYLGENLVPFREQFSLTLEATEQFADGSAGQLVDLTDSCGNKLSGLYKSENHSLRIRVMTSTLVACLVASPTKPGNGTPTPTPPNQPKSFPEALSQTSRFTIHGPTLDLLNRQGAILARFKVNDQN
jgi:heat shock protein HslJ